MVLLSHAEEPGQERLLLRYQLQAGLRRQRYQYSADVKHIYRLYDPKIEHHILYQQRNTIFLDKALHWPYIGPTMNRKPKSAGSKGPKINLRFRTRKELDDVRRAAREKGMSLNSYILVEVLSQARNLLAYNG